MVRVNNKPQYLVFYCHFTHLSSKHGQLPVESRKQLCLTRSFSPECTKISENRAFSSLQSPISSLFPQLPRHKAQNQCSFSDFPVQMWTLGPGLGPRIAQTQLGPAHLGTRGRFSVLCSLFSTPCPSPPRSSCRRTISTRRRPRSGRRRLPVRAPAWDCCQSASWPARQPAVRTTW